uniref:Uncharacterized protein n=1 Tax=Rhizophora mucronata TaxID=61149 RepID=A0A2P2PZ53_RHIMU
MGLLITTTK